MGWRFEPGEGLREAFSRVAREEIARVRGCLSAKGPDLETAVHEARQGFKRLRALVRLAKPQLGEDFAVENRRWRDASRLLSGSRDTTVLLQTFDKIIAKCNGALAPGQSRRLRATIKSRADRNGAADVDPHVQEVLALLDEADEAIVRLNWPDSPASLLKGLQKSQGRLRKAWKKARKTGEADALHSWRKSVKDQAAQLRLLRGVAPGKIRARRNEEKAAGELLGNEHDLWLLSEHLRSAPSYFKLAATRDLLLSEIGREREGLREEAFRKGKGFSSDGAKSFAGTIASAWKKASSRKPKPPRGKGRNGAAPGGSTSPGP